MTPKEHRKEARTNIRIMIVSLIISLTSLIVTILRFKN